MHGAELGGGTLGRKTLLRRLRARCGCAILAHPNGWLAIQESVARPDASTLQRLAAP
jgi:hypothetical protein